MGIYIIKRIFFMIPILIGITLISFFVIHLAPGNPLTEQLGLNPKVSAASREMLSKLYGLNKPLLTQYYEWLKRIVTLNFGVSFTANHEPVITEIKRTIGITIIINSLAMFFIFLFSIPLGVMSAVKHDSIFDKITTVLVFIGFAAPSFWVALLLIIFFGIDLHILPIGGITSAGYNFLPWWGKIANIAKHLVMPVFVAGFGGIAGLSRYLKGNMLEVYRQDYILTARAKGLKERTVIYKHAMKNALIPFITILGLSVPGLIGGSVIIETIFDINGMGRLFYQSVLARDYPTIMGILVIGAVLTLIGNLLADIAYALVDPRLRK
ncbi:MAG: ABC transporter permease, partial [Deltaproteobacteria bacterium]|uniref:ABC transporter permease n=1 Tax=Candidatus Acidulodesulfobacterium acidiphilum TaxID=2597224 RepID=A0A520XD78_9DELT|nr:ABC transporter permease [Deltaproteobacteria bacterium]RZV39121.1 MAG: ABC transporter permease [Candidatus Acidulodesulfobacterium acidiphilum]